MANKKEYLGDGVYAEVDSAYIILTTEDGVSRYNTIYLESKVIQELQRFIIENTEETPKTVGESNE